MKIVDRKTFLTLQPGTVYAKISEPWAIGELCIKHETAFLEPTGDWYFHTLTDIESSGSDQWFERLTLMHYAGASFPVQLSSVGRDGLFEADAIFMVYEQADIEAIRDLFSSIAKGEFKP